METFLNQPKNKYILPDKSMAAVTCFDKTDDVSEWPDNHDRGFHIILSSDNEMNVSVDRFEWVRAQNNKGKFRSDPVVNMKISSMDTFYKDYDYFGANTNDWTVPGFWSLYVNPDSGAYVKGKNLHMMSNRLQCYTQAFTKGNFI